LWRVGCFEPGWREARLFYGRASAIIIFGLGTFGGGGGSREGIAAFHSWYPCYYVWKSFRTRSPGGSTVDLVGVVFLTISDKILCKDI